MLHRIKLPDCETEFEAILQFQRDVLAFVCHADFVPLLPVAASEPTPLSFSAEFELEKGEWLWRKCWIKKNDGTIGKSELYEGMEQLIQHIIACEYPDTMRQNILHAFDHDTKFQHHVTDDDFQFEFTSVLDPATQKALQLMMKPFYTKLLASGFPTPIHGQSKKFDRNKFIEAFWRINYKMEVCPGCDGPRPDRIDKKGYDDGDHFLPKSKYPFLAVHLYNLVPICTDCNRKFKLARDPLEKLSTKELTKVLDRAKDPIDGLSEVAPLKNSFLPYQSEAAVDYINVVLNRNDVGVTVVDILDRGKNSRQIASLKRVFRLHERWPDRMRYQYKKIEQNLGGFVRGARQNNLEKDELRQEIIDLLDEFEGDDSEIGQHHWGILRRSYLRFALGNDDEFETLYEQFLGG